MTHTAALDALAALLGDRLSRGQSIRDLHGANETHFAAAPPDAVAFPQSTEEVSEILKICHAHDCPVIPYGAGSGLEGQHLAIKGGVTLDMGQMNKVLAVQDADMIAVVQPGVTREQLNEDLRASGLFFPVDPGANASIGGMTATRASGTTAVRYGTMAQNVLALEAVMADGTVIRTGTQAPKSSAGYDLTHMLVGSEGTLGIITEITLRLQGQPEAISAATCRFPSVANAVDTVILTIQSGIPMARIELVDEQMVKGFNLYTKGDLPEEPHLFVEFHGSPSGVAEQAEAFGALAEEFGGEGFAWTSNAEERNALWKMRHGAHYATATLRPGSRAFTTDVCVPISRLAEAVALAQAERDRLGVIAPIVGHVGDGNFHCSVRIDPDSPEELEQAVGFSGLLAETALKLGGTVSGEHGIGLGKMKYMGLQHGPALNIMRAVKTALDPTNILNPGKMLPPGNQ